MNKRPLLRAFLWGLAAALALPPAHLLPVLLFSVPAFLRLIGEAGSIKRVMLIGWLYGFGLALAGLYWVTEPILTEASTFWWLVPLAAPALRHRMSLSFSARAAGHTLDDILRRLIAGL